MSGEVHYLLSINYDITDLMHFDQVIKTMIESEEAEKDKQPEQIVTNVNDLLDNLIEQSVALVGKPAALMNKEEKITAIQFLNEAGAFLITKSGDKVSKYFGISKFTLYPYIYIHCYSKCRSTLWSCSLAAGYFSGLLEFRYKSAGKRIEREYRMGRRDSSS